MLTQDSLSVGDQERLYIFHDTSISTLFTREEKGILLQQAKLSSSRNLKKNFSNVKVIDRLNEVDDGQIFQLTNPIYTSDSVYALIDGSMYFPLEKNETLADVYIGQMLFIFKKAKNGSWKVIRRSAIVIMQ